MSSARCTRSAGLALGLLVALAAVATPLFAERTYIVELTGEPAAVTAARAAAAGSPLSSEAIQQLRDDHPDWQGLTAVQAESFTGAFSVLGKNAPRTTFLTSLGFTPSPELAEIVGDDYSKEISAEDAAAALRDLETSS